MDWDRWLPGGGVSYFLLGNIPRSRVLVLSGTKLKNNITVFKNRNLKDLCKFKIDTRKRKRLQHIKETNDRTNKMNIGVFDLGTYFPRNPEKNIEDQNKRGIDHMVQDIQNFCPTTFILAFSSVEIEKYPCPLNHSDEKFDSTYGKVDIIKEMKEQSMLQDVIAREKHYIVIRSKGIFQKDKCFLSAFTATSRKGLEMSIPNALDELIHSGENKVLIISGSRAHEYDSSSGLTQRDRLDDKMYKETCALIGVDPNNENDYSPEPVPQKISPTASQGSLLNKEKYRTVKFLVLNIKHFCNKENEFIDFVRKYDPHAIIIDWSYSKDSDVANVLCSSGIVPEMRLTFERTALIGTNDMWVKLDNKQREALNHVADIIRDEYRAKKDSVSQKYGGSLRHVVLYGGHGTGKTLLGTEVAKMFMSQLRLLKCPYELHVVVAVRQDKTAGANSILLDNLEKYFFKNEDYCDKKVFSMVPDLENKNSKNVSYDVSPLFDKLPRNKEKTAVIFMDEMNANTFRKSSETTDCDEAVATYDFSNINFGHHENIYTVTCVSPVISESEARKYRIHGLNDKELLGHRNMYIKNLEITYRNGKEIQMFYNVFQAHYEDVNHREEGSSHSDVITGFLQQPDHDSKENELNESIGLPSGEMPHLLVFKEPVRNWAEKEFDSMKEYVSDIIDDSDSNAQNSVSCICINQKEDCRLCELIKEHYKNKPGSVQKMSLYRKDDKKGLEIFLPSGFNGCEDDTTIIHFSTSTILSFPNDVSFELFSRARKKMLIMISEHLLEDYYPFCKTLKELINHDEEECINSYCKEHDWTKKKVINVHYPKAPNLDY